MLGSCVRGAVWVVVYLLFILAPLFALLLGSLPPTRDFWTEFAVAIGYSGLAMMGLQFGLTARFRYVTAPWGEDVIYHFHRQISQIAVGLVVAHALIMSARYPEMFALPSTDWRRAIGRSLRIRLDLRADRVGGDGPVACETQHQLRDVAPQPYRFGGGVRLRPEWCTWWGGPSTCPIHGSARCGSG